MCIPLSPFFFGTLARWGGRSKHHAVVGPSIRKTHPRANPGERESTPGSDGETVEDTVSQVRTKANQITNTMHKQAEDLQQRGQDLLDEQKERWMPVVEAGKTAAQGA